MPPATNPIVASGADPWVILRDKTYYYCYSRDDRICVRSAAALADIGKGPEVVVWTAPKTGDYSREIWAPELHLIGSRYYIYFAADDGDNANHRMYVLESEGEEPRGPYRFKGKVAPTTDRWAIDGTVGLLKGHWYFVWSGWEGTKNVRQDLFIAAMHDPWTLSGERVCISVPEHDWEKVGPAWDPKKFPGGVNEGPEFLERDGTVHLIYSANGSWTDDYCLGQLTWTGGDPLSPRSWRKRDTPVFSRTADVFGPGHACFVRSPDGKQDWIVYHAAKRKGAGWDRDVRTQTFTWGADKSPRFGRPLPPGRPIDTKPEE
jgi:GH43 family beta-xylosidase